MAPFTALKPCPWCKKDGKNLDIAQMKVFWVECIRCLATGPPGETEKEAVEYWNGARVRRQKHPKKEQEPIA